MRGKVPKKSFHILLANSLFLIIILCNISHAQTTYNISGYCYSFPTVVSQCYCTGNPSLEIQNGYLFDADSWGYFEIIDIHDPTNISEVTSYNLPSLAAGIAVNGNYAYVAGGSSGLQIFDISNFSNLTIIGAYNAHDGVYGVALQDNYAYVAVDTSGLEIVDISDPTNPVEVGSYATPGVATKVVLNGNYAYVGAQYAGLRIIDISNVSNPVEVGHYTLNSNGVYDFSIKGNYVYIAYGNSGLRILDISNPTNPIEVDNDPIYFVEYIRINENYAYITGTDNSNYEAFLIIMDISNPTAPQKVAFYFGPSELYSLAINDRNAFLSYPGQLQVLNINVPLTGVTMNLSGATTLTVPVDSTGYYEFTNLTGGNYSITPSKANYTFAPISKSYTQITADQTEQDFYGQPIYTISGYCYATTSTAISNVSITLSGDTNINAMTDTTGYYEFSNLINGNYAVTPSKTDYFFTPNQYTYSGLTVDQLNQDFISIFTTYQISGYCYISTAVVGSLSIPANLYIITLDGNYALVGCGNILNFIDISNPYAPYIFSAYTTPGYIEGITINGNYAYIADGNSGLRILDISNPSATYEIGSDTSIGNASSVSLQGNYAYIADYDSGLKIIDISNPTTLFEVGSFQVSGNAVMVQVNGNYAYLVGRNTDFDIIDISNPSSPFGIGSTGYPYYSYNFEIRGNYAYIADENGFIIVDISNPFSPYFVNQINNIGYVQDIILEGNIAYVVSDTNGFSEIDIQNPLSPSIIYTLSLPDPDTFGIVINGNYAYVVGSYTGTTMSPNFYVVNKNNFMTGVQINLSGDTNNVYYSDTTGYYAFDGLLEGNYFVTAVENSYSFSPSSYSFLDLTTNPSDQNFLGSFYVGISNWMQYGTDPTNILKK